MRATSHNPKSALRAELLERRRRQPDAVRRAAARAAVDRLCALLPSNACVGLYAAFDGELSVDAVSERRPDLRLAWPRVDRERRTMTFVAAAPSSLSPGAFGIREPRFGEAVPAEAFDAMLVPGVAFSLDGARLGMGLGFYDRFFAQTRADIVKIGVCYEWQLTNEIPEETHDIAMDGIVTDARVAVCDRGSPLFRDEDKS